MDFDGREITSSFWPSVTEWLKNFLPTFTIIFIINTTNITFGFFRKYFLLLNHIVILCKQVIFQSQNLNRKPSFSLLNARININHKSEVSIAKQNKMLEIHNKKVERTAPCCSQLVKWKFILLQLTDNL